MFCHHRFNLVLLDANVDMGDAIGYDQPGLDSDEVEKEVENEVAKMDDYKEGGTFYLLNVFNCSNHHHIRNLMQSTST